MDIKTGHLFRVKDDPDAMAATSPSAAADMDDAALMRRIAAGDRAAYGLLVQRYLQRTLAVTQRVLLNRAEAEDVTQEVFLKIWQRAGDWQAKKGAVSTWLYRIALNRALDALRKVRPRQLPEDFDLADETPGAPEALIAAERRQALKLEMEKLPARQRVALALSYQAELRDADAARSMEISVKAYESLLVRARKALRARLMAGGWHEAA